MLTNYGEGFNPLLKNRQNALHMADNHPVDLSPQALLAAYADGAFPMADAESGEVKLFTCDPRCVIPLESFRLPKSAVRALRGGDVVVKSDTAFEMVMRECATDRSGENRTWINDDMLRAYAQLHALGHAHSVEAWRGDVLVGGLYGVSLGGAFFGESMFVRPARGGSNSSKACLAWLVGRMRERGFTLLDSQFANDHMLSLGAVQIPAEHYLEMLDAAIMLDVSL